MKRILFLCALTLLTGYIAITSYSHIPSSPHDKDISTFFSAQNAQKRVLIIPFPTSVNAYTNIISQPLVIPDPSIKYELYTAVRLHNTKILNQVLEKYHIDYILLDNTVHNDRLPQISTQELKQMLADNDATSLAYKSTPITVYQVDRITDLDTQATLTTSLPVIGPRLTAIEHDIAFEDVGIYATPPHPPFFDRIYPFIDLSMISPAHKTNNWVLQEDKDHFYLVGTDSTPLDQYDADKAISTQIITFDTGEEIESPLEIGHLGNAQNHLTFYFPKKELKKYIASDNKNNAFTLPLLHDNFGYLVKINREESSKIPLLLTVTDSHHTTIRTHLVDNPYGYIILPPLATAANYNLSASDISSLANITIYLFPYHEAETARLNHKGTTIPKAQELTHVVSHVINNSIWTVGMIQSLGDNPQNVVLYAPYNEQYRAWVVTDTGEWMSWINTYLPFVTGRPITRHVTVNSWANGWQLEPGTDIYNNLNSYVVIIDWDAYKAKALNICLIAASGVLLCAGIYFHFSRSKR